MRRISSSGPFSAAMAACWLMLEALVVDWPWMMAMAAILFALIAMGAPRPGSLAATGAYQLPSTPRHTATALGWLSVLMVVLLWLSVLMGTYRVFPMYRATPPADAASLVAYPRALLMSNPDTRWLHAFGMEVKEHMPWIAAMLATAVAFITFRYRGRLLADDGLRRMAAVVLTISFVVVAFVALMGVFVNKVAPVE